MGSTKGRFFTIYAEIGEISADHQIVPFIAPNEAVFPPALTQSFVRQLSGYNQRAVRLIELWHSDREGMSGVLHDMRAEITRLQGLAAKIRAESDSAKSLVAEMSDAYATANAAVDFVENLLKKPVEPGEGEGAQLSPLSADDLLGPESPMPIVNTGRLTGRVSGGTVRGIESYNGVARGTNFTRDLGPAQRESLSDCVSNLVDLVKRDREADRAAVVALTTAAERIQQLLVGFSDTTEESDEGTTDGEESEFETDKGKEKPGSFRGLAADSLVLVSVVFEILGKPFKELMFADMGSVVNAFRELELGAIATKQVFDTTLYDFVVEGVAPEPIQASGQYFSWLWSFDGGRITVLATLKTGALADWNKAVLRRVHNGGESCRYFVAGGCVVAFDSHPDDDLDPELRLLWMTTGSVGGRLAKPNATAGVGRITRERHRGPYRDIFMIAPAADGPRYFDLVKTSVKNVYPRYRVQLVEDAVVEPADMAPEPLGQPEDFLDHDVLGGLRLPEDVVLWGGATEERFREDVAFYRETLARSHDLFDPGARRRNRSNTGELSDEAMRGIRKEALSGLQMQVRALIDRVPSGWAYRDAFEKAASRVLGQLTDALSPAVSTVKEVMKESERTELHIQWYGGDERRRLETFQALGRAFARQNIDGAALDTLAEILVQVRAGSRQVFEARIGTTDAKVAYDSDRMAMTLTVDLPYDEKTSLSALAILDEPGRCFYVTRGAGCTFLATDETFSDYDETAIKLLKIAGWRSGEIRRVSQRKKRDQFEIRHDDGDESIAADGKVKPDTYRGIEELIEGRFGDRYTIHRA